MTRLHIQRYLDDGGALDGLAERYAIKTRRHTAHPNLLLFKYDQIASPFDEPLVRECRGIVLDESDGWRVVCRAFDKFFNHGEGHAAPIDWATARVQEKLDGSLATIYRHQGAWHVATTGTPDASGEVNGFGVTFADYFWRTYTAAGGGPLAEPDLFDLCFSFELMGPINRIVVQHSEPWLRLLSVRNRETGEQFAPESWTHRVGITAVQSFPLDSFEAIAATFSTMSPLAQEGYVVVDGQFNRVKVKHPGYVALHHAKDGMSRRAIVDIARSGETSEVVAAFPEFGPMLDEAKARLDASVAEIEADYARLKDIPEQKSFAIQAVKTRCSAALFQIRAGKVDSVRAFLRKSQIDSVMDLIGYRRDEGIPQASEAAS